VSILQAREPDFDIAAVGGSLTDAATLLSAPDPPEVFVLDVLLGEESGLNLLPAARMMEMVAIVRPPATTRSTSPRPIASAPPAGW